MSVRRGAFILACCLFAAWLTACSQKSPDASADQPKAGAVKPLEIAAQGAVFKTGALPFGWKRFNRGDATVAYRNRIHNSIIMVNMIYAPNRKADLRTLRNHLLFDITDRKISEHETILVDQREALWTVVDGKLDGAAIRLAMATVRIDERVYDLVYIASPETYGICLPDFKKFIAGFHQHRAEEPEE